MKRALIIFVSLTLVVSLAAAFLLRPAIWRGQIESYLNHRILEDAGWQISIGALNGHLFTTIQGTDFVFHHASGAVLTLPSLQAKVNLFRSLLRGVDLGFIRISRLEYQSGGDTTVSKVSRAEPGLGFVRTPVRIRDLEIDGVVRIALWDTVSTVSVSLQGAVLPRSDGMVVELRHIALVEPRRGYTLALSDAEITVTEDRIETGPFTGTLAELPISGDLSFTLQPKTRLTGDLVIDRYTIPERLFKKVPLQPQFTTLRIGTHLDTDFKTFTGTVVLTSTLGLEMEGNFTLQNFPDRLVLSQLTLASEEAQLASSGLLERAGRISGQVQLEGLDLSQWLTEQKQTDISGLVLYEGQLKAGQIEDLSLTMEVQESQLFPEQMITFSGTVAYHDSVLDLPEPFTLGIGPSTIVIKGFSDFHERAMDLALELTRTDIHLLNRLYPGLQMEGAVTGNLRLRGGFDRLGLDLDVTLADFSYRELFASSIELTGKLDDVRSLEQGSAKIALGAGRWRKQEFDNGTGEIQLRPDEIIIDNLQVNSGTDYLQLSGRVEGRTDLQLDRLQLAYRGHYLVNPKPVFVHLDSGVISVKPFVFHIDDGIAEGYLIREERLEGRLKLSNIDSELLSPFIRDERLKISGMIFGELGLQGTPANPDLIVEVSLKNGRFAGQKFDDMVASFLLRNGVLHIDELSLIDGDRTAVQVSGVYPLRPRNGEPSAVDLRSHFKNLDMARLTQFIPDWFDLGGVISGQFNLGGTTDSTRFDFDVAVQDAAFDRLALGAVTGKGRYDGRRLHFTSFSSDRGQDHVEGSAFIPVDYNLSSETFGSLVLDDSLWVDARGRLQRLDFLSTYIEDVDSITGDFNLALQLRGTPRKVIRDGFAEVRGGRVYTILLDDPITHLQGSASLIANQFMINQLSGRMRKRGSGSAGKNNVNISGKLDLTYFFRPRYDLHVTGKNVYFRALIEDIEGLVDLDINVFGRDTVTVTGEIAAVDVEMFQEFVSEEIGTTPPGEEGILMNYKLNFPIRGDFTLLNSQIEAKIQGEVSITQFGNRPADYGGELYVQEGKFYYYGDIFTISDGYLAFDNRGFNPYLDISAYTVIEGERINISLVGPLDNPQLQLSSDSGFSQSDILELLTLRRRFEEQEISSTGFGKQAQAILGAWFESQLEKNLMQLSGLGQLGVVEDVSISGLNPASQEDFSVEAKAGLSEKVFLNYAYRRSFSLTNPSHMLGVELKVNRYLSLVGNVDQTGNFHVKYRLRYSY
jgi:autotransporter translocation and assembly factor TamB